MIETWPGKGTLAIWAVSGVAAVAAIVSHNDQLLLKAGGLFLSATAGEFFQETMGRQIRRLRRDLLSMPRANKAASYNNRGHSHDSKAISKAQSPITLRPCALTPSISKL